MKKLMLTSTAIFFLTFTCRAQDVPQQVKDAFTKKFSQATEVEWESGDGKDGSFEADFKMNGQEYEAVFSADGTWKQTETEISEDTLPVNVKQTLARDYVDAEIEEVDELTTPRETLYEVAIEFEGQEDEETHEVDENEDKTDEDDEDEEETQELIFREDGTVIKKVSSDSEDEDQ